MRLLGRSGRPRAARNPSRFCMLSVLLDEQPGGRAMTGQVIRRVGGLKQWLAGGVLALAAHAAFAQVPGLPLDVVKAWKASKLPESSLSLVVQEVGGPRLVALNAKEARNPASVMKLVTTWAALSELGPNYVWRTEFMTAPGSRPDAKGVLAGPLYLRAGGDPQFLMQDLWTLLRELRLRGAWFFQARRDVHGVPRLLEVAPRIAGSMALSRMRGVNFALLHVYAYLDRPFSVLPLDHAVQLDRALGNRYRTGLHYRRVYLDLDDTLILDGKVNPIIAALLYQWSAADIEVVLLTRHRACPRQTLEQHRLCPALFARIVHLRDGSEKSAAIAGDLPAIFIDDAFSERRDVREATGIPVFDLDAVEQLLDTRS